MFKEIRNLVTGTNEEIRAQQTADRLRLLGELNPRKLKQLERAQKITRRLFLRRLALGTTGIALTSVSLLGITECSRQAAEISTKKSDPEWVYSQLPRSRNRQLPGEIVKLLTDDLKNQTDYPELMASANVISASYHDARTLGQYDPLLASEKPINIEFAEIGSDVARFSGGGRSLSSPQIELVRKDSSGILKFQGIEPDSKTGYWKILLNNYLLDHGASPWVYRLMIAKEASHPLYYASARKFLIDELRESYDIPTNKKTEENIVTAAIISGSTNLVIPNISPSFRKISDFIDYAGYGHIVLVLGNVREKGLLRGKDEDILFYNLRSFEEGVRRGIIQANTDTSKFEWSRGVSPFSSEWFNVMTLVTTQ